MNRGGNLSGVSGDFASRCVPQTSAGVRTKTLDGRLNWAPFSHLNSAIRRDVCGSEHGQTATNGRAANFGVISAVTLSKTQKAIYRSYFITSFGSIFGGVSVSITSDGFSGAASSSLAVAAVAPVYPIGVPKSLVQRAGNCGAGRGDFCHGVRINSANFTDCGSKTSGENLRETEITDVVRLPRVVVSTT